MNNDRVPFGPLLAQLRATRWPAISQSKLAARSDFDHSYISRLECGSRNPTRDAVLRLAEALGTTPEEEARLLAAAGFVSDAATDPLVERLTNTLADELPDEVRSWLRQTIAVTLDAVEHGLVVLARAA